MAAGGSTPGRPPAPTPQDGYCFFHSAVDDHSGLAHRPQTDGKVERFDRTLVDEWAYVRVYRSEDERRRRLDRWLQHLHPSPLPHALGDHPPVTPRRQPAWHYSKPRPGWMPAEFDCSRQKDAPGAKPFGKWKPGPGPPRASLLRSQRRQRRRRSSLHAATSAVTGSMTRRTLWIRVAGKPPHRACSRTASSLSAR